MATEECRGELSSPETQIEELKYTFKNVPEYTEKEILSMEKEMLGIYISGHPLDKLRETIKKATNIDTMQMLKIKEENKMSQDGKQVKYAGIVTSIKKKYTRKNTLMAFVTVEDLYGTCEIIVFDSTYMRAANVLMVENVVLIEGRLSLREDDDVKIVANNITNLNTENTTSNPVGAGLVSARIYTTQKINLRHNKLRRTNKIKTKRNDKILSVETETMCQYK